MHCIEVICHYLTPTARFWLVSREKESDSESNIESRKATKVCLDTCGVVCHKYHHFVDMTLTDVLIPIEDDESNRQIMPLVEVNDLL